MMLSLIKPINTDVVLHGCSLTFILGAVHYLSVEEYEADLQKNILGAVKYFNVLGEGRLAKKYYVHAATYYVYFDRSVEGEQAKIFEVQRRHRVNIYRFQRVW